MPSLVLPPVGCESVRPRVLTAFRAREAPANSCSLRFAALRANGGQVSRCIALLSWKHVVRSVSARFMPPAFAEALEV